MLKALYPSELKGEVEAIASKSFVHRALIAAALSDIPTLIKGRIVGDDAAATASCLKALGSGIEILPEGYKVTPVGKARGKATLDCSESGSTLRFILPLACALGAECEIIGRGRLAQRPLAGLIKALSDNGAEIEGDTLPLKTGGKLRGGDYIVPANISSQYITGLLLALPILDGDSRIILKGEAVSAPYIDITLGVLELFGIEAKREAYGFYIKGGQKYISSGQTEAEGDWSNAAFFIAGGTLGGDVTVKGLSLSSRQGDKAVIDILKRMGADITIDRGLVRAKKSALKGVTENLDKVPDLAPVLSIAAMRAEGATVFEGVRRLKDKESDRLSAIIEVITELGGKAEYKEGSLIIYGGCECKEAVLSSYNDHRMAMSAAIAAINHNKRIILDGSESVSKSYPDFFTDYKKLGGKADDIHS